MTWNIVILYINHKGFTILEYQRAPYLMPWILFGIFKYGHHMGGESEWAIGLGYHRINLKWLWSELKKKRTLKWF